MSAIVCLNVTARTAIPPAQEIGEPVKIIHCCWRTAEEFTCSCTCPGPEVDTHRLDILTQKTPFDAHSVEFMDQGTYFPLKLTISLRTKGCFHSLVHCQPTGQPQTCNLPALGFKSCLNMVEPLFRDAGLWDERWHHSAILFSYSGKLTVVCNSSAVWWLIANGNPPIWG